MHELKGWIAMRVPLGGSEGCVFGAETGVGDAHGPPSWDFFARLLIVCDAFVGYYVDGGKTLLTVIAQATCVMILSTSLRQEPLGGTVGRHRWGDHRGLSGIFLQPPNGDKQGCFVGIPTRAVQRGSSAQVYCEQGRVCGCGL